MAELRVLIVDEHALARQAFRTALDGRWLTVMAEAKDGDEAIRLLGFSKVDAVLLSLRSRGVNGLETLLALKEYHPALPVAVLVEDGEWDTQLLLGAGAASCLPMTEGPEAVAAAIRAAVTPPGETTPPGQREEFE